ncbi:auxin-responsive protein IAA13 isoform X2 [Tanacetum coccineum]
MVRWPMLNNQNWSPKIGLETRNEVVIGNNGYLPVKVTMDGISLGHKVDLRAHDSYETLTQTLDDKPRDIEWDRPIWLSGKDEYMPTYKDHEGDLMFAEDISLLFKAYYLQHIGLRQQYEVNKIVLKFREEDSNNENFRNLQSWLL